MYHIHVTYIQSDSCHVRFEALTAMLLRIRFFQDFSLCHWVSGS